MKPRTIIGIIFIVASLLKLAAMWGLIHWSFLESATEGPVAIYFAIFLLIFRTLSLHIITTALLQAITASTSP